LIGNALYLPKQWTEEQEAALLKCWAVADSLENRA
jgi:hypothetical protein